MTRINTTGDKQDRQAMLNSLPHLRNQVSLALSSRCAAPQLMRSAASGLTVNQPGDHYEQEAERVAEQVMHIEEPRMVRAPGAMSGTQRRLQRKCSGCEEEEKNKLHRKENGAGPGKAPSIVHEVLRSSGRPLDSATRAFMEPRFGHDFSKVSIHADAQAARSAQAVHAQAYTVGNNIVFASGRYAPHSPSGGRLLAHELAHTIQQGSQAGLMPTESQEHESEIQGAEAGLSPASVGQIYEPLLQRQPDANDAYDIQLTYPPNQTQRHQGLSLPAALRVLRGFAGLVDAHLEGGYEGHRYLRQIHDDQYIVAGISDILGGRSIPPLAIWSAPRARLVTARASIDRGDVDAATRELQQAAIETRAADRQVYEYREGTIAGAERAVFGLEVVKVASAVVVTVGTGGTAGVFVGAGYAGAQRLAGEAASVHYGLQDRIDWAGVAFDTLFALVAGRFGGRLGSAIASRLGGQITARVASSLIVGRASGLAHAAARELFDALRGRTELTVEGFIQRLADQLTVRAVFLDLVAHAAGTATQPRTPAPGGEGTPSASGRGRFGGTTRVTPTGRTLESVPSSTQPQAPVSPESTSAPRASGATTSRTSGSPTGTTRVTPTGRTLESVPSAAQPQAPVSPEPTSAPRASSGDTRVTASLGGTPSVQGNLAVVAAPEPIVEPVSPPVPAPAPEAPRATGTGSSPGSAAVPGAVAVAAVAGSASSSTGTAPQIRLVLPPQKAAHADLYGSLIRARQLQHTPGVPRRTAQATNWDRELRPGGPMEIYSEIWQRFEQMEISETRRLRPDWSRTLPRVDMQVDHRVEWQLLGTANRRWGDTIANYELLDQPSNGSAGSTLRSNIQAERQRLATSTGNPSYLTHPLVFTDLVVPSTVSGAMRWLPEEIQQGDHYYALLGHQRDRIRRGR